MENDEIADYMLTEKNDYEIRKTNYLVGLVNEDLYWKENLRNRESYLNLYRNV